MRVASASRRTLGAVPLVLSLAFVPNRVGAQCYDSAQHFRSGLWKEWVVQILPGPQALAAIERIVAEMNEGRALAQPPVPPLVFDPEVPLLVSVLEENNPRGPNGASVPDRTPNREVLLGSYAVVDGGGPVLILLADPLRSNSSLTATGIAGVDAVVRRSMSFEDQPQGGSLSSTRWSVTSAAGSVKFGLTYPEAAISQRSRFPPAADYLNCGFGLFLDEIFRSSPAQTIAVYDRSQTTFLFDLTRPDVKLQLKVRHVDPYVNAIFNDPGNVAIGLSEAERAIRWQRR